MKTSYHISKLAGVFLAVLALTSAPLLAGPGPQQVFRPVKDYKALSALSAGSQVAVECPHCGTVGVSKVGSDKSHTEGFTCPECKLRFTFRDTGSGKARAGRFVCVDDKGREMSAKVCASRE